MTISTVQQHRTVPDVADPVVRRPVNGHFYTSPLSIWITEGADGYWRAKKFTIDFHPHGPKNQSKDPGQADFVQPLPLGPNELHTVGVWYDGVDSKSSALVVSKFFVLTPPAP